MELPHGHILDGSVSSPDALWFIFHLHVSEQLNDKKTSHEGHFHFDLPSFKQVWVFTFAAGKQQPDLSYF